MTIYMTSLSHVMTETQLIEWHLSYVISQRIHNLSGWSVASTHPQEQHLLLLQRVANACDCGLRLPGSQRRHATVPEVRG